MTARAEPFADVAARQVANLDNDNTYTKTLAPLTDAELGLYIGRAYRGAAAAWRDLNRAIPNGPYSREEARTLRMMQLADAKDLDAWYATLRAEQERRA